MTSPSVGYELHCTAPNAPPGHALLAVSPNGVQFVEPRLGEPLPPASADSWNALVRQSRRRGAGDTTAPASPAVLMLSQPHAHYVMPATVGLGVAPDSVARTAGLVPDSRVECAVAAHFFDISPPSGPVTGGTVVTVHSVHGGGASSVMCSFGATAVRAVWAGTDDNAVDVQPDDPILSQRANGTNSSGDRGVANGPTAPRGGVSGGPVAGRSASGEPVSVRVARSGRDPAAAALPGPVRFACIAPPSVGSRAGSVTFALSLDGGRTWSAGGASFQYYVHPPADVLSSAVPRLQGITTGGTQLLFSAPRRLLGPRSASGGAAAPPLLPSVAQVDPVLGAARPFDRPLSEVFRARCRFGDGDAGVVMRAVYDEEIEAVRCLSPPFAAVAAAVPGIAVGGAVPVAVAFNAQDFTPATQPGRGFRYVDTGSGASFTPRRAPTTVAVNVTITGWNTRGGGSGSPATLAGGRHDAVWCVWGDWLVQATVLSWSLLGGVAQCPSPAATFEGACAPVSPSLGRAAQHVLARALSEAQNADTASPRRGKPSEQDRVALPFCPGAAPFAVLLTTVVGDNMRLDATGPLEHPHARVVRTIRSFVDDGHGADGRFVFEDAAFATSVSPQYSTRTAAPSCTCRA